jgi:hypothetical protein
MEKNMDQTKTSVITGVLAKQADRNREVAQIARREMGEHTGAAQVLALLSKQMPGFADAMEKRIEGDAELGRAADAVRVYVKNVIAQFNAMCESQAAHQRKQAMLCEGRAQGAEQMVLQLEKDVAFETAAAARRDELEAERRAKAEAEKSAEAPPATDDVQTETPRKTRKRKAG